MASKFWDSHAGSGNLCQAAMSYPVAQQRPEPLQHLHVTSLAYPSYGSHLYRRSN